MIFLSKVTKIPSENSGYPFSVPAINDLKTITFSTPVTFLVGENGTGKSTFLESLAVAINSHTIGEEPLERDQTLSPSKLLAENLKLSWKIRTHKGFFVRSEDVFGFTKYLNKRKVELDEDADRFNKKFTGYGRMLAVGAALGQKQSFEKRYGRDLDANSHGETFLKIFQSRFVPGGLYLLDEPETPLSFKSQLALVLMLREMIKKDAQFIIATHSPILTALPEATIYSFDNKIIHPVKYNDIESFQLMRDFLNNPEAFLKNL
jgi:predicted ATPase